MAFLRRSPENPKAGRQVAGRKSLLFLEKKKQKNFVT
jgi:hypothetical protein